MTYQIKKRKAQFKKIALTIFFIQNLYVLQITAQSNISFGIGIGGNYSKLFLEKSESEYIDTYSANFGLNLISTRFELNITKKISVALQPEIIFTSSEDKSEIKTNAIFLNVPILIKHRLHKKFGLSTGVYYQYLLKMNLAKNGDKSDFTSFANHRSFFNPSFGLSYFLNKNISFGITGVFSTKDLFNGGAEDMNGNIIGPLKTYNHFISLALWYQFEI